MSDSDDFFNDNLEDRYYTDDAAYNMPPVLNAIVIFGILTFVVIPCVYRFLTGYGTIEDNVFLMSNELLAPHVCAIKSLIEIFRTQVKSSVLELLAILFSYAAIFEYIATCIRLYRVIKRKKVLQFPAQGALYKLATSGCAVYAVIMTCNTYMEWNPYKSYMPIDELIKAWSLGLVVFTLLEFVGIVLKKNVMEESGFRQSDRLLIKIINVLAGIYAVGGAVIFPIVYYVRREGVRNVNVYRLPVAILMLIIAAAIILIPRIKTKRTNRG